MHRLSTAVALQLGRPFLLELPRPPPELAAHEVALALPPVRLAVPQDLRPTLAARHAERCDGLVDTSVGGGELLERAREEDDALVRVPLRLVLPLLARRTLELRVDLAQHRRRPRGAVELVRGEEEVPREERDEARGEEEGRVDAAVVRAHDVEGQAGRLGKVELLEEGAREGEGGRAGVQGRVEGDEADDFGRGEKQGVEPRVEERRGDDCALETELLELREEDGRRVAEVDVRECESAKTCEGSERQEECADGPCQVERA